ncbi:MAG: hypothetical protein C0439_00840 [Pseudomonas sp.]|nr:hypothetical protein [Pseudomonas sp.]
MILRTLVFAMALAPLISIQAATKAASDEVEYLIPEDWDSKKDAPPAPSTLELTPKTFHAGMAKHLKEMPQCSSATLGKGKLLKDGDLVAQVIKQGSAEVDVILEVAKTGKISNAKFTGPKGPKDDPQLRLMMCSTYAIMRTLQPELESPEAAAKSMNTAWVRAAKEPFKMGFYFSSIRTQFVPFEMNVF